MCGRGPPGSDPHPCTQSLHFPLSRSHRVGFSLQAPRAPWPGVVIGPGPRVTPFQTLWRGGSGWGRLPVGSSRRLGGRGFVKHVGTILQQRKANGSESQNLLEQFVSRFRFLKADSDVLMARREAGLPLHLTQRLGGLNRSPRVPGSVAVQTLGQHVPSGSSCRCSRP